MPESKTKVTGDPIVGIWYLPDHSFNSTPRELLDNDNIEWKASDPNRPEILYPYINGIALLYDEEA